ncbi:MAG: hypothetical protein GY847_20175 [Proteobacteria bacterium]|nr:hypothetical protein [Pseudomonadota bacterium]
MEIIDDIAGGGGGSSAVSDRSAIAVSGSVSSYARNVLVSVFPFFVFRFSFILFDFK